MKGYMTIGVAGLLAVLLGLMTACSGGGGGGSSNGRGGGGGSSDGGTKVGDTFPGKLRVTAVDRSKLAIGAVAVTVRNQSDKAVSQLEYRLDVYYRNTGTAAMSKPYDADLGDWGLLSLRAGQSEVLRRRAKPKAHHVELRVRARVGSDTVAGNRFLDGQVVVTSVRKDEFAIPPRLRFVVKSSAKRFVRFAVRFERDGKTVGETEWTTVKLVPGVATSLEPSMSGITVNPLQTNEILLIVQAGN